MLRRRLGIVLELIRNKSEYKELLYGAVLSRSMFILEKVYGISVGYRFNLSAWGVYSALLEKDMERAMYKHDVADKNMVKAKDGSCYYEYTTTEGTDWVLNKEKKFIQSHKRAMDDFYRHFAHLTLDELELSTTIIFYNCDDAYGRQPNAVDVIARKVNETRPKFSLEEIFAECTRLKKLGILERPMEQLACVS